MFGKHGSLIPLRGSLCTPAFAFGALLPCASLETWHCPNLSLMLAAASELTMADPPRAQSDKMDAVSIDSDGAADANRAVGPLRVKSGSGEVKITVSKPGGAIRRNKRSADGRQQVGGVASGGRREADFARVSKSS